MKLQLAIAATALAALGVAGGSPAYAKTWHKKHHKMHGQKAHVVKRNKHGRAIEVSVNGKTYAVCDMKVKDNCINPRQAGLNFGNEPLDHWPGHPASEKGKG